MYTLGAVVIHVLSIDKGSFQNKPFCKFLSPVSRTNRKHVKTSFIVSNLPFSSKCFTYRRATIHSVCLSLPLSFRFNITSAQSYMQALAFISFPIAVFYNAMLSRYVILCIYRALYVCHVVFHRLSPAFFIA